MPLTYDHISRLSSYYLECLSKDMDSGISCYALSHNNPAYEQLFSSYILSNEALKSNPNILSIVNRVILSKNKTSLMLGYPIFLKKAKSKAGNTFYLVEPLLLLNYDSNSFVDGKTPKLRSDETPRLNSDAIKSISGLDKYELFTEVNSLSSELGLNNPLTEQPTFDEIIIKLRILRPKWNWKEVIFPEILTEKNLKTEVESGIYNAAALFIVEQSKFTQGLVKELSDMKNLTTEKLTKSILGQMLNNNFPQFEFKDQCLVEPLPLNAEQRYAVKRALQAPLTVIKGPPGTGKSQVVTCIIINAVYQGQTILVSSKNNKAVEVVGERVNGLTSRPLMLRLGNYELQTELAISLSDLLSSTTTKSDNTRFEASKKIHEELSVKIGTINTAEKELINIRNKTDEIEQAIEKYRDQFGDELFLKFKNYDERKFEEIEINIQKLNRLLIRADINKQSFFTKSLWFALKKARMQSIISAFNLHQEIFEELNIETVSMTLEKNFLPIYNSILDKLKIKLNQAKGISNYFNLLDLLKNQKSFFQLAIETKFVEDSIAENSYNLWESWLSLLPGKLTQENRKDLGDYTTLLGFIADPNMIKSKDIWEKFYSLQAKATSILSCWAVTSLSVRDRVPFESGFFDLLIIDEASQCDIASALPLLYRAKRAVIIGDEKQLKHISSITKQDDLNLLNKYNLFENHLSWSYVEKSLNGLAQIVCSAKDIVELRDHHRSHADIINFSNKEFYDGKLRVATKYEKLNPILKEPALKWIDVKGKVESPQTGSCFNQNEAEAVVKELKRVVLLEYKGTIGVVTPFRPQATLIKDLIEKDKELENKLLNRDFLAEAVHSFQGDERDVMIFSPVVADGIKDGSKRFLERNENLFNVAITRARAQLIIIGDKNACLKSDIKYLKSFVKYFSGIEFKAIEPISTFNGIYPSQPSNYKVSDWEKKLYEALYKSGIKTRPQYNIVQYVLDLALFDKTRKLDIEVDGEEYHRGWDGELCRRDQLRNTRLIEMEWDVLRFWVYEIRDDMDGCVKRVREWLEKG